MHVSERLQRWRPVFREFPLPLGTIASPGLARFARSALAIILAALRAANGARRRRAGKLARGGAQRHPWLRFAYKSHLEEVRGRFGQHFSRRETGVWTFRGCFAQADSTLRPGFWISFPHS